MKTSAQSGLYVLFAQSAWTCWFSPICIALYLSEQKFIFHFNTVTPVRSFCDYLQSATLVTTLNNLVASANLVMSLFTSCSRFLMNIWEACVPSTDPAGVLQVCNKPSLWKMTLYSSLTYLWKFHFFPVFKLIVHPCQSIYFSSAGSHFFVFPRSNFCLSRGSNYTHDGMFLVTNAVICYIVPLSFLFPVFLLFIFPIFLHIT